MEKEVELKCKCGGRIIPMINLEGEFIFFKCLKCKKEYTIDDLVDLFEEEVEKRKGVKPIPAPRSGGEGARRNRDEPTYGDLHRP